MLTIDFFGRRVLTSPQFSSLLGYAAASPSITCNNWSRNYGNYQECPGNARVELSTRFSYHRHNAHNWCG